MKLKTLFEQPEQESASTYGFSNEAEVRSSAWPYLQQEIEKLNKKAMRVGAPPIVLTQLDKFLKPDSTGKHELWIKAKIEGKAPMVDGYKFVATIEHKDAGNIIRTAPGYTHNEQIKSFYDANPDYCDQCKKVRRRNDTFIVQDKDGNLRQIGRNCLRDFLGGRDPKSILWYFSLQDMAGKIVSEAGKLSSGPHGKAPEYYVSMDEFLPAAAAAVRVFKYRKTRDANGEFNPDSTANMCRSFFFHSGYEHDKWQPVMSNPTPEDDNTAKAILAWWNTVPPHEKDNSEFLHNLDVLIKGNHISSRDVGFAAALFPAYYRANPPGQPTATGPIKKNEHVGSVGSKIPPTQMKIVRQQEVNGPYGRSYMTVAEDSDGRLFMWFDKQQLDIGQNYNVSGTVKKQDEFKGRKQTVLTRVKN